MVIGGEEIRAGGSRVGASVADDLVCIDAPTVDVAHIEAIAILRRISIAVVPMDAAIGGFLVLVTDYGAQDPSVGRIRPALPQVVTGFGQMPKVVDHAGGNKCRSQRVEGDSVGVAGALGKNLELVRDRVEAPHGAGEGVFLALMANDTGIEYTVETVEPAVGTECERARQLMGVMAPESGDHHLGFTRGFQVVSQWIKKQVGGIGHPYPAITDCDSGRDIQPIGKNGCPVRLAIPVGILEHFHAILAFAGGHARVLDAFGHPDSASFVEAHGHRVHQHWFTGDEVDLETFGNPHPADGFAGLQGRTG